MLKIFAMIILNLTAMCAFVVAMLCVTKDAWGLTTLLFFAGFMCTKYMYELCDAKDIENPENKDDENGKSI